MGLGCWWSNGLPSHRSLASLEGRVATLELRQGSDFYERQQCGILDNERKLDPAIPRVWSEEQEIVCKALLLNKNVTLFIY